MTAIDMLKVSASMAPVMAPWLALATLIAVLLRAWQPFRKMNLEREAGEVTRLTAQVTGLADELKTVRADVARERQAHERQMTLMRHRLNNEKQALDMLLTLLELRPERVDEVVAKVRSIRAENDRNIALERGLAAIPTDMAAAIDKLKDSKGVAE